MTIVSRTHRLIFVHLRKCGGSSVEAAYQPQARWCDLVIGSTKEGEALQPITKALHGLHKHNSAADLKAKLPEVWDKFWTFSTVRNPYAIYESYYRWITKIVEDYARAQGQTMAAVKADIRGRSIDRPFMGYDVIQPFAAASDFADFAERLLRQGPRPSLHDQLSEDGALIVDKVFHLEEIGKLWRALGRRTGGTVEPKHTNRGAKTAAIAWSPAALDAVRQVHAQDFAAFGYGFDPNARRPG